MRRVAFVVTGRVQGVGFRAYAQLEARRLGLVGFVQNRRDGSVNGEAQGAPEHVAEFVQWLHRGPRWAGVESVATEELAAGGGEGAFEVRR
jgi:acylphosphatase